MRKIPIEFNLAGSKLNILCSAHESDCVLQKEKENSISTMQTNTKKNSHFMNFHQVPNIHKVRN